MKIQTFIFNWPGVKEGRTHYELTCEKVEQLKRISKNPIVINSDDDHKEAAWHNIGDRSFFAAQFLKALDLFDGDILFHIQADASYDNWLPIYKSAVQYFERYKWGIYAPNVDFTWYTSERTDLDEFNIKHRNLKMVANPDCTCWMIHKDVLNEAVKRKIDFAPYHMGWSFDIVYTALAFMMKRPVIRDYQYTITHPNVTNYSKPQAETEMHDFYNALPEDIQKPFSYIKGDIHKLVEYYKKDIK